MTRNVWFAALSIAVLAVGAAAGRQTVAKKGYIVAQVEVTNPQQYAEYMKVSPGLIEKFGGRFVVRGGPSTALEGPPPSGRIVIVDFPTVQRAQEFYNSPEYQAARQLRAGAASAQFILIEGS